MLIAWVSPPGLPSQIYAEVNVQSGPLLNQPQDYCYADYWLRWQWYKDIMTKNSDCGLDYDANDKNDQRNSGGMLRQKETKRRQTES